MKEIEKKRTSNFDRKKKYDEDDEEQKVCRTSYTPIKKTLASLLW